MKIELKTDRLTLVPMELKYLESTHSYAGDKETTRFMMFLPNDSLEETKAFIIRCQEQWASDNQTSFEFAIIYEGKHAGGISLDLMENNTAELGWIINKDFQRKGIATEAARKLIQFAKDELHVKKFIAHCDTENIPSYRTMEKLGMCRLSESGGRKNKGSDEERREYLYEMKFA